MHLATQVLLFCSILFTVDSVEKEKQFAVPGLPAQPISSATENVSGNPGYMDNGGRRIQQSPGYVNRWGRRMFTGEVLMARPGLGEGLSQRRAMRKGEQIYQYPDYIGGGEAGLYRSMKVTDQFPGATSSMEIPNHHGAVVPQGHPVTG